MRKDRKDILIYCQGESAGSASVTYHLLSPLSQRNLFEQNRCHTLVQFILLTNSLCSLLPPSDRRVRLCALRVGFRLKAWATRQGGLLLTSLFFYFLISYWKDLTSLKRNSSLPQPPFSLCEHYCYLISMSPLDSHFSQDLLFTECFKTHWLSNWWYEQAGHLPQGSNIFYFFFSISVQFWL